MASAMMGLRRRVPAASSGGCSSAASERLGSLGSTSTSSKRSRSENNNSPSHGNLNNSINGGGQGEPPTKKSRSGSGITAATQNQQQQQQLGKAGRTNSSRNSSGGIGKTCDNSTTTTTTTTTNSVKNQNQNPWPSRGNFSSLSQIGSISHGQNSVNGGGIPYIAPSVAPSVATFVGNGTNLNKGSASVSYLDISNMTGGSLTASGFAAPPGAPKSPAKSTVFGVASGGGKEAKTTTTTCNTGGKKFRNDCAMFAAYQPWVIKTYGDLAKTKTITIKKYARILRTLRGEEANSAENSKFRFWVKSKGFHIGQPDGYDAKPADRIVGRHAVTSPGLDPPLYVPTQPPHNKALNGAEGTIPPGRVYKKVAIVENFFDIIHAVHVDLEGRPGKHAGQKRTYRTITETYAFLPREAVTRFLLGCTECQRRPRTPSPTNLTSAQHPQPGVRAASATPASPTPATTLSASPGVASSSQRPREASHAPESKSLFSYRHTKHQKASSSSSTTVGTSDKLPADEEPCLNISSSPKHEKEEKYNPLSITNLLKKDPPTTTTTTTTATVFSGSGGSGGVTATESLTESRRTPESDRASSRSSASSKRRRMLPEGRTPSPQPSTPLPRPWSPSIIDSKDTPIDYSLPITTTYLKHQQKVLAEKNRAASETPEPSVVAIDEFQSPNTPPFDFEACERERERFSPAAGLIDTNLNLLATIQHLHCQVMLALTERLRPAVTVPNSLALPQAATIFASSIIHPGISISSTIAGKNHS